MRNSRPFVTISFRGAKAQRLFLILLSICVLLLTAWQTYVTYGHLSRYGGEAESGYHRGQVELSGGNRYIRAGDDNVYWTSSQVLWINGHMANGRRPAMVYHAFAPNSNNCGGVRIENMGWSWSNLPSVFYVSKRAGCLIGKHNEWRAVMDTAPAAGTYYYFQHLFKDINYPSSSTGEVTVDSYWHYNCWGTYCSDYNDYHGKFCVNTTNVAYSPTGGSC